MEMDSAIYVLWKPVEVGFRDGTSRPSMSPVIRIPMPMKWTTTRRAAYASRCYESVYHSLPWTGSQDSSSMPFSWRGLTVCPIAQGHGKWKCTFNQLDQNHLFEANNIILSPGVSGSRIWGYPVGVMGIRVMKGQGNRPQHNLERDFFEAINVSTWQHNSWVTGLDHQPFQHLAGYIMVIFSCGAVKIGLFL